MGHLSPSRTKDAAVTVHIFASHPVAIPQYVRVVRAQGDLRLVGDHTPCQVGVFDGESPSVEAVLTLARLRFSQMRPLLLSSSCDTNESLRWLFRGVWGLVDYERYQDDLPRAIRRVAADQLWFPSAVVARWNRVDQDRRASALRLDLTPREQEVMGFLLRRFSNKEIANILHISDRTAKMHVSSVLNKLQVASRYELASRWVPGFETT